MECNKDEAVRARGIAEQKMQNGDFEGAKKFALKAQKLFPELENISQLLTVCDVHNCAKQKLYGSEMDWYGILQIEHSADEASIKKQYRKLALLLHPDKNKFAGAETAFKLIGEANRILTDQTKRSQYDMKCRVSVKTAPKPTSHPSNRASSVNSQYEFKNNYQNGSSKYAPSNSYQQTQNQTFWTMCSACGIKYQYYKDLVNRLLRCHACRSSFVARDFGPQGNSWSQFSNQKGIPNRGPCNVYAQSNVGKPSRIPAQHGFAGPAPVPKAGSSVQAGDSKKQEKVGVGMSQPHEGFRAQQKVDGFSNAGDTKKGVDMPKTNAVKQKRSGTSKNAKKRERKSAEESDTGSESEVEHMASQEDSKYYSGLNLKVNGGHRPRRSSRRKQHVFYEEKLDDDDDEDDDDDKDDDDFVSSPIKKSQVTATEGTCHKEVKQKASSPPEDTVPNKKGQFRESKQEEEEPVFDNKRKASQVDSGTKSSRIANPSPEVLEYPDPEFTDFDKYRTKNCFAVNQVWAIYDTCDGMPRFYAKVKKVLNPGFNLRITWLEADPDEENEKEWFAQELPVSCGKYCYGYSQTCVDRMMFSHRIDPVKCFGKHNFLVYPRKGETWALFRDWDFRWSLEPQKHKPPYRYDFVEVLTDFDEEIGVEVAHLSKVKGFVSIVRQTERDGVITFQVSAQELYRFSHRIPSCRMTGREREGVPVGSFELDPASIPINLDELIDPVDTKLGNQNQVKATRSKVDNLSPVKNEKSEIEREASAFKRMTRESSRVLKAHGQVDAGWSRKKDDSITDVHDCNVPQPEESFASSDAVEKMKTPKKFKKNDLTADCLNLRRSPRDLSKRGNQVS